MPQCSMTESGLLARRTVASAERNLRDEDDAEGHERGA